jgi:hypothetical protein
VGLRLKAFIDSFGGSGTFQSTCAADFVLKTVAEELAARR